MKFKGQKAERLDIIVTTTPLEGGRQAGTLFRKPCPKAERVDDEALLAMITCPDARLAALMARVHALRPYELPEIAALPVCGGSGRYPGWVRQSARPVGSDP